MQSVWLKKKYTLKKGIEKEVIDKVLSAKCFTRTEILRRKS